jgi:cobalt-zinc-cadmium efflux system outer membrane protein
MFRTLTFAILFLATTTLTRAAAAQQPLEVTFEEAMARASRTAPDLAVARAREQVARAEVGAAGIYPNPSAFVGTSTKTAKLSAGVSIPLYVFGQRGASINASRADLQTVRVDSTVTLNEVRAACAHAFIGLWLAQRTAEARAGAAEIARKLDTSVEGRVEVGNAPEVEGLRVHAERLRADADAMEAEQLVAAAGSELARWIAAPASEEIHASGDPPFPDTVAPLGSLLAKAEDNPVARREEFDARAAEARADRERAWVRPAMSLDLSVESQDPTVVGNNYRATLGIDIPVFNQRGPLIEREAASAGASRARAQATRARIRSELVAAWRMFVATGARRKALADGVVPAAERAAAATEESYSLGRAALVAVLDAERARIDARVSLIEARAANANAWIEVQSAMGWP